MNDIVVFLGPTLARAEARARLDARYLPPVSQGDVVSVLDDRPRAIAIIDGHFQRVPAVWHKEILLALDRGVTVLGAASMGALRAAELADFGMIGVGRIYGWYRSGFLEADDEVAVIHAPAELGHAPLSVAMVDIRATLDGAVGRGVVSLATAVALLEACARTPYWLRSHERLTADGRRLGLPEAELDALVRMTPIGQKRLDALALLDRLAEGAPAAEAAPPWGCERTTKLDHLIDRDVCVARDGERRLTALALADFYRLWGDQLGAGSASLSAARRGAAAGEVIARLRAEDRYAAVLAEAVARDCGDGVGPCEGDDVGALAAFRAAIGVDASCPVHAICAMLGFRDAGRLLERLHRFGWSAGQGAARHGAETCVGR